MAYTIGEAAEKLGVPASTLRYYDKEGLLPFVDRSAGGIRMFSEEDFDWLRLISCLKTAGMPIRDIRRYIEFYLQGDETIPARRDMFYARRDAINAQIAEMEVARDMILYKCWLYEQAAELGSLEAAGKLGEEALPQEIREIRERLRLAACEPSAPKEK